MQLTVKCLGIRQLRGWRSERAHSIPPGIVAAACSDSGPTSYGMTIERHQKEQALAFVLHAGYPAARSLLTKALSNEQSRFLVGELFDIVACFQHRQLLRVARGHLQTSYQLDRAAENADVWSILGAARLAESVPTLDSLDALLAADVSFDEAAPMQIATAVASVAQSLARQGHDVWPRIRPYAELSQPAHRRQPALRALALLARSKRTSIGRWNELLRMVSEPQRSSFEASLVVSAFVNLPGRFRTDETERMLWNALANRDDKDGWLPLAAGEVLAEWGLAADEPNRLREVWERFLIHGRPETSSLFDWRLELLAVAYSRCPEAFEPDVSSVLHNTRNPAGAQVLSGLAAIRRLRGDTGSLAPSLRDAAVDYVRQQQGAMWSNDELFNVLATVAPFEHATAPWSESWDAWTPHTRATLADSLGQIALDGGSAARSASSTLCSLALDSDSVVRRSALRALFVRHASSHEAEQLLAMWSSAEDPEVRVVAAEAFVWFGVPRTRYERLDRSPQLESCVRNLESDKEPFVREALTRAVAARQRRWRVAVSMDVAKRALAGLLPVEAAWSHVNVLQEWATEEVVAEIENLLLDASRSERPVHLRWWMHRVKNAIAKRLESEGRDSKYDLSPGLGFSESGQGTLLLAQGGSSIARYATWVRRVPAGSSRQYSWGAVLDDVDVPDIVGISILGGPHQLALASGATGMVRVSAVHGSRVIVSGIGPYPEAPGRTE
jgi:hypothetical protein